MELLLALIVLSPLAGSVGVWILGELAPNRIREFTLGVVSLTFLLTVPVVLNPSHEAQLSWTWVERPEIRFCAWHRWFECMACRSDLTTDLFMCARQLGVYSTIFPRIFLTPARSGIRYVGYLYGKGYPAVLHFL